MDSSDESKIISIAKIGQYINHQILLRENEMNSSKNSILQEEINKLYRAKRQLAG